MKRRRANHRRGGPARTTGRVLVKLAHEPKMPAPAHLDVIAGAARPSHTLDKGGPLDRCVHARCSGMRTRRVFHARDSFGHPGEQGTGFADDERELGLDRIYALEISEPEAALDVARSLRDLADVEWAMPEPLSKAPLEARSMAETPRPTREQIEAPHRMIGADKAHAMEPGSPHVLVAVIDTGVALEHSEFANRIYGGYDTVDLGMGWIGDDLELVGDSVGADFAPYDTTGHGTHVAGIIGANGIHVPQGVGGASRLAAVRALAAARNPQGDLFGIGGTLDIDAAIKAGSEMGARVINMSFGTPVDDLDEDAPPVHRDAIAYALSRGAVPLAAMGNSGTTQGFYPAVLDGVIAVGAVGPDGRHADFSTRGEHCALVAPGVDVVSVGLVGYRVSTGSSHSTPFVSGVVALMLARADREGVTLDAAACRRILRDSAQPAADRDPPAAVGAGVLDAPAALRHTDAHVAVLKGGRHG